MPMLEILHEVNQLEAGGVERIIHTIATMDKRHKHKILSYKDGPMRKVFEDSGIEVIVGRPGQEFDVAADLIHVHTGGQNSLLAEDLKGAHPIVETVHSPVRSAVRKQYVDTRVGVSALVCRMNDGSVLIENGADLSRLDGPKSRAEIRTALGIPQDAFVVGRIGRVAPDKYVEEFLLTLRELQRGGTDCWGVVAGQDSGRLGFRSRMKMMAQCLPVKNCLFPESGKEGVPAGYWEPREIVPAFDVFLYPSKDEGFGLVFVEAMLLGVPVVTYKTELTIAMIGGRSVLTGDSIKDLAQGVLACAKIGADSLLGDTQDLRERFDGARMAGEYSDLYDEVAKKWEPSKESLATA